MTREEKAKAIDALKLSVPIKAVTQEEFYTYIQTINQIMDWLEQEPRSETVTEFADRCRECGREKVLDKIGAEIKNHCGLAKKNHCRYCSYCNSVMGVREILEIIDKYKAVKEHEA